VKSLPVVWCSPAEQTIDPVDTAMSLVVVRGAALVSAAVLKADLEI